MEFGLAGLFGVEIIDVLDPDYFGLVFDNLNKTVKLVNFDDVRNLLG